MTTKSLILRPFTVVMAALLTLAPGFAATGRDVAQIYKENCGNCHGANLEGAQALSLVDASKYKRGTNDFEISRSIREGYTNSGMPAMLQSMTEPELRAMVIFIRERMNQDFVNKTKFARPVPDKPVQSEEHTFTMELVADKLSTPWSLAFLPDCRILVTELKGSLRIIETNGNVSAPISGTPAVRYQGQGGLMEVALHPGYASNGWVYLSYSDRATNDQGNNVGLTAVVRGRIRDGQWIDQETIFRMPPKYYLPSDIHFGSRIVFDDTGHIFFCTGERGMGPYAQDLSRPNGKVYRLFDDGRIPPDNPFVNQPDALPSVWSYGHRNPQGLARHPVTGELWEAEHGPRGGDELNLIQRSHNYGWPIITYGMNYDGTPITDKTSKDGMDQPIVHWTPSIAVCAINFYTGDRFPKWKNNLLVTALAQQELRRLVIEGHQVSKQEILFKGIGRVRYVTTGLDGNVYVCLNQPDRVVRLVPAVE